jgi:hypothetical protein
MTRVLQNRLALANVKVQNGWGHLPLDSIEPRMEQELKRKRPTSSSNDALSDTSSSLSGSIYRPNGLNSSPLTAPIFSEDLPHSGSSRSSKRSKQRSVSQFPVPQNTHQSRTKRISSHAHTNSWKRNHQLPESSPTLQSGRFLNAGVPTLSFVTEATIPDDAPSASHSEDDDSDLPLTSLQNLNRQIRSSPPRMPRTPSPDLARSARLRSKPFAATSSRNNEDAADLLMFLAASPSPAVPSRKPRTPGPPASSRAPNPPSTPPQQKTPLPSSMLSTPGGSAAHFVGLGAATPGVGGFNFSDYLNVTPSPAQAAWRTPGPVSTARTPLAGREHAQRRTLHFDGLMPPGPTSPETARRVTGLGMELGGELVSSQ